MNSHFKMIKLNKAYSNLKKLVEVKVASKRNKKYKDLDYSIYKKGVGIFKNIHPSQWKKVSMDRQYDISVHSEPETINILENLIYKNIRSI